MFWELPKISEMFLIPAILFSEIQKNRPDFGKKGPDWLHPWGKFSIQNVVLRVSRRKQSHFFLVGHFMFIQVP